MATRLFPYSRYDFVATEHYLAEQAELGRFVISLGSTFIHFEEGTPERMTYRFVPVSIKKREAPTPEERELFSANDWQFVDHLDGKFHLYKTNLETPKEIPIPLEQQQEVMAKAIKGSSVRNSIGIGLLLPLLAIFIFYIQDFFLDFVLEPWHIRTIIYTLVLLVIIPFASIAEGHIHKRLKRYAKDISILEEERKEPYIPHPFRGMSAIAQLGIQTFAIVCLILSLFESSVPFVDAKDVKDTTKPIPYVSLEVLSDGNVPFESHYYLEKSSFFAPVQYDIWLQGYSQNTDDPNYQIASMQFDYYYIPTDFLVEPVLETLVDTEKRDLDVTTVEYDGLDAVYLQDVRGDYTSFWMQKGNIIVSGYYHYVGAEEMTDISKHLDLFAKMMK
ncbi:DUF2812 domain-containing protein [Chakrabartyella piscis]|uniref:DUF2812 domain-containing protein n=1 Tax=Chakrabartyella piscis TaxID=2918914 RepID=UPI002958A86B|nr:DUF2812 domain-containing protein [Chakrabartyella piscis]